MSKSSRSVRLSANTTVYTTKPVYQYDHGLIQMVYGDGVDSVEQIHFSNIDTGHAVSHIAEHGDGVISSPIPDALQAMDKEINAYLYVENAESTEDSSGYTIVEIKIPMKPRAKPETITLNSPNMGPVNELAAELRQLIGEVDRVNEVGQKLSELTVSAHGLGEDALPTAEMQELENSMRIAFGIPQGKTGETGGQGPRGESGVYIGSSRPEEESVTVWIKNDGWADTDTGIEEYIAGEISRLVKMIDAKVSVEYGTTYAGHALMVNDDGCVSVGENIRSMAASIAEIKNDIEIIKAAQNI